MEALAVIVVVGLFWLIIKGVLPGGRTQPTTLPTQNQARPSDRDLSIPATQLVSRPRSATATWIPAGQAVEIQGFRINDGLIYIGSHLDRISGYGTEPALINPRLPVRPGLADYRGEDMPYWPSYSEISPEARAVYLRWLAEGRRAPQVSMGIVFLFFYGLERRFLAEFYSVTEHERSAIIRESDRLLDIYGENRSFRNYATQFRDVISISLSQPGENDEPPPEDARFRGETTNTCLRVALGNMAKSGRPVPADWALAWVDADAMYFPRTPAQRCRSEFVRLFRLRYQQRYGDGYLLRQNKTRIKIEYRPASASFGGPIPIQVADLPDVTVLKEPIDQFRNLAVQCTDELDSFSRFLGRYPDQRSGPSALALLPAELLPGHEDQQLDGVRSWLSRRLLDQESVLINFAEIAEQWPALNRESFGKRDGLFLAQCFHKLGFGMEPDVRFGGFAPTVDGKLVLFRALPDSPSAPSTAYSALSTILHLAALVIGADEEVTDQEEKHLENYLFSLLDLAPGERQRLHAHMRWLLNTQPGFGGIKKRLESLSAESRSTIGHFLVAVAGADGYIAPAELSVLAKIYRLLDLDVKDLYSRAHTASTEPVVVQQAGPKDLSFTIPQPPQAPDVGRVSIDMERVHAMRAETDKVSSLLRNIFVGEEAITLPKRPPTPPEECILGLDVAQSAFLRRLVMKTSWSRAEVEMLAAEQQILLEGTLDSVNEAALDRVEERLLDGDEPIEVNLAVWKELRL